MERAWATVLSTQSESSVYMASEVISGIIFSAAQATIHLAICFVILGLWAASQFLRSLALPSILAATAIAATIAAALSGALPAGMVFLSSTADTTLSFVNALVAFATTWEYALLLPLWVALFGYASWTGMRMAPPHNRPSYPFTLTVGPKLSKI